MTIDELLLYDAEAWITPLRHIHSDAIDKLVDEWGWESYGTYETDSWFCLLLREAIK